MAKASIICIKDLTENLSKLAQNDMSKAQETLYEALYVRVRKLRTAFVAKKPKLKKVVDINTLLAMQVKLDKLAGAVSNKMLPISLENYRIPFVNDVLKMIGELNGKALRKLCQLAEDVRALLTLSNDRAILPVEVPKLTIGGNGSPRKAGFGRGRRAPHVGLTKV